MFFLQSSKRANRIYATVVHGKIRCDGFKDEGITVPSSRMQSLVLEEFYRECGVPASLVSYVEVHGTGTKIGDPGEVNAIDLAMSKNRPKDTPLLIGSVKSNLGHTELASGLVSILKVHTFVHTHILILSFMQMNCLIIQGNFYFFPFFLQVILAMETGLIASNLHYNRCKRELKAIAEGRLKVVDQIIPWIGPYAGVNSYGFGGAYAHVLLRSHDKEKVNEGAPDDDLPRLVAVSGRTEQAVDHILSHVSILTQFVYCKDSLASFVAAREQSSGRRVRGSAAQHPLGRDQRTPVPRLHDFAATCSCRVTS